MYKTFFGTTVSIDGLRRFLTHYLTPMPAPQAAERPVQGVVQGVVHGVKVAGPADEPAVTATFLKTGRTHVPREAGHRSVS